MNCLWRAPLKICWMLRWKEMLSGRAPFLLSTFSLGVKLLYIQLLCFSLIYLYIFAPLITELHLVQKGSQKQTLIAQCQCLLSTYSVLFSNPKWWCIQMRYLGNRGVWLIPHWCEEFIRGAQMVHTHAPHHLSHFYLHRMFTGAFFPLLLFLKYSLVYAISCLELSISNCPTLTPQQFLASSPPRSFLHQLYFRGLLFLNSFYCTERFCAKNTSF